MPFHDRYLVLSANISDQIANPRRHLAVQRWPPVLRDPHQMKVDIKYSVRAQRKSAAMVTDEKPDRDLISCEEWSA
jgi:hypothetical protein